MNTASLVYPADIDDEHYMKIDAVKRSKQTIKEPKGKKIIKIYCITYTGNLQVQYQADYENKSLGIIGGASGRIGAKCNSREEVYQI